MKSFAVIGVGTFGYFLCHSFASAGHEGMAIDSDESAVERVRDLSPNVFWPKPQVHSTLVRVRPDPGKIRAVGDVGLLVQVAGGLFAHRRKTCVKSLEKAPGLEHLQGQWGPWLKEAGIRPDARGDTVSVAQAVALARAVPRDGER